jgi:AcrR family transcriptional regulator
VVGKRIRTRPGRYAPGVEAVESILQAAANILVEDGYPGLTIRRIALACATGVGNVSYHFPTKQVLIGALLDSILHDLHSVSQAIYDDESISAEERLKKVAIFWISDLQTKYTTRIFPALWAMAGHDAMVAAAIEEFYDSGQRRLSGLIAQLNPALPAEERHILAVYFTSVMEGMTIYGGYEKPNANRLPWLAAIAVQSFVQLAKTLTAEQVRALEADWPSAADLPIPE